ncbi:glycosyltransferase family 2 protein [Anaerocolumna sp.]|uniref:glycosyltransferase family 2 protein n=1 Tax=Anaerocolumna sp. TaxID=2041569 RepID=UPI0028A9F77F|nr:glycosyltransferase family 2 protein [Anaerocolumna sp.]
MLKFSVIMPTYNRAHIIKRAIKSVLNQSYTNWELIIVDDGSQDNTEEVIKNIRNDKIRYIKLMDNRGVNTARNVGIELADSDYITFLDSDDEFLENTLEIAYTIIKKYMEYNVFAFKTNTNKKPNDKIDYITKLDFKEIIRGKKNRGEHLFIVKTSEIKKYKFYDGINGGESILWLKMAQNNDFLYVNECLRIYNQDVESITRFHSSDDASLIRSKKVYEIYLKELKPLLLRYNVRGYQGYTQILSNLAKVNILLGNHKQGLKLNLKVLKYNIFELRAYRNLLLFIKMKFSKSSGTRSRL